MAGRSVFITGGNRGIGKALAEAFVAQGDKVAVTYRSGDVPEGVFGVQADVTDGASLDAAFAAVEAEHGPVEILIANAGITRDQLLMRMSDEDFEDVLDTNLSGAFRVVRRASMGMIKKRFGRIILISSVVGLYGSPGQVNYSSSKSGMVGMARSITRELGARGITANVIAPGFVESDMTDVLSDDLKKQYLATIPAKRFAKPTEIAELAMFLASPAAGYISGQVINVDGGLGMGH